MADVAECYEKHANALIRFAATMFEPEITAMPEERRPRRAVVATLAAASLLVAGVVGWQLLAGDDSDVGTDPTQPVTERQPTAPSTGLAPSVAPPVQPPVAGWTELPAPPLSPRTGAIAAWTGSEVVVVGGGGENVLCPDTADCSFPNDAELFTDGAAFDPRSGNWRRIADAPIPPWTGQAVAVDGDVYVSAACIAGRAYEVGCPRRCRAGSECDHVLLRYDPAADEWAVLESPPGGVAQLVPAGRWLVSAADSDESSELPDFVMNPDTMTWDELPDDPLMASYDRQFVWHRGSLHLFAKPLDSGDDDRSDIEGARYDLETGEWEPLAPSETFGFNAWLVGDEIVINPHFSPESGGGIYDISSGRWSPLPEGPPDDAWTGDMAGVVGAESARYSTEYGGRTSGWVLDVPSDQWLEMTEREGAESLSNSAAATVGRSLFVYGGERRDVRGGDGEVVGETWMWTPPGP